MLFFGKRAILQRTSALGDIVMVEPVIDFLLKEGKRVTFITSEAGKEIFQGYERENLKVCTKEPYLRHLLRKIGGRVRLKYERFPQTPAQEGYAKNCGLNGFKARRPKLYYSRAEKIDLLQGPYVLIHKETASLFNYRKIYGIEWDEVESYISSRGFRIYFIEGNYLKGKDGVLIKLTINDLKSAVANSHLFIGNDSFPSHLAVVFNIPSIIFFGAVDPKLRHPDLDNVIVMQNDCEYRGCYHNAKLFDKWGNSSCQIVGREGEPPCCVHSTLNLLKNIGQALEVKKAVNGPF